MDPNDTLSEREPSGGRAAGFGLGLFVGALVGAAVALLFAPAPGQETRRRLKRRFDTVKDELGDRVDEADQYVRRQLRRRR